MLETLDVFIFTLGQTECWRSKADGMVLNPYWKSNQAIAHHNANFATIQKTWSNVNTTGPIWSTATTTVLPSRLLAGDIVLVNRLDGPTVSVVRDSLDGAVWRVRLSAARTTVEKSARHAENTTCSGMTRLSFRLYSGSPRQIAE